MLLAPPAASPERPPHLSDLSRYPVSLTASKDLRPFELPAPPAFQPLSIAACCGRRALQASGRSRGPRRRRPARVFALRMFAVKKSIKGSAAASPRSATIAGTTIVPEGDDGQCRYRVSRRGVGWLGLGHLKPLS